MTDTEIIGNNSHDNGGSGIMLEVLGGLGSYENKNLTITDNIVERNDEGGIWGHNISGDPNALTYSAFVRNTASYNTCAQPCSPAYDSCFRGSVPVPLDASNICVM